LRPSIRPAPLESSDRIAALVRHLPFPVDDFDAARDTYARWRSQGADPDLETSKLWAYCYVVWYFYGKFAREKSAGPSDLDQVIERSCRRIFRSIARVRDPQRFPHYVSVVCRNVFSSYRDRRQPMSELPELRSPAPEHDIEVLDRPLVRRAVERAVAALPTAIGEVARMRLLENRSYTDIAEATGRPVATTRTYMSKALVKLRDDPDLRAVYLGDAPSGTDLVDDSANEEVSLDDPFEVRSAGPAGLRHRPPTA